MTRIGLLLIVICAISGATFYFYFAREKPPAAATGDRGPVVCESGPDVDFGPYMAGLQRRIRSNWKPPKSDKTRQIQLVFRIHSNGVMTNLRLILPSGVALADQAALKAIQNSTPFAPLPDGAPDSVDIQFTFDQDVYFKEEARKTSLTF